MPPTLVGPVAANGQEDETGGLNFIIGLTEDTTMTGRRQVYLIVSNNDPSNQSHRLNINLGMNDSAFSSPSTRNGGSINITWMDAGYNFVANSIFNIVRQQCVRRADVINDDLIHIFGNKLYLVQSGVDSALIQLYD